MKNVLFSTFNDYVDNKTKQCLVNKIVRGKEQNNNDYKEEKIKTN